MLYILSGQDDLSLRESLEQIKGVIGDQTLLAANTTELDGQQVTLEQLRMACETLPFLAEKRLVIVEGLLERFEPESRARRKKKSTDATRDSGHKTLASYLSKIPESTILILVDGKVANSNPLLKELSGKAVVKSFPLLGEAKLRQWIQKRVASKQSSISPAALDRLIGLVGANLWIMSTEIDKLAAYASGRRIEDADIKLLVSSAQEASVFAMVDAILDFQAGAAEQRLQELLRDGAAPAYLLAMLARQLQLIVRAKELKNQRKPEAEIQSALGLTMEFALRKTLEQGDRYPWPRLKSVYHKLLEADLAIKTGKYKDELALNILIAELCQR